jgi:hypothetical protein
MQGWGENNPPRPFWLLGQADPGPALPSGPVLVQKGILDFWAKVGPIHFGPRSAQHLWGCVRPSWLGRPSPAQFNFILCILFVCCIIYIYIYMKKLRKFCKNYFKNIVDFSAFVLSKWINIWLYFYTVRIQNPVLKYPICVKTYKKIHI